MASIEFTPIGVIHSPYKDLAGMPIQPAGAQGSVGEVHVDERYAEGLADLDGFSHVYLFYLFHKNEGFKLKVKPFMDTVERGLFATRAPRRPNMLGMSIVELEGVSGSVLRVRGVDVLDGTPLLDIKPYVARFDAVPDCRCGWLEANAAKADTMRSDARFTAKDGD